MDCDRIRGISLRKSQIREILGRHRGLPATSSADLDGRTSRQVPVRVGHFERRVCRVVCGVETHRWREERPPARGRKEEKSEFRFRCEGSSESQFRDD